MSLLFHNQAADEPSVTGSDGQKPAPRWIRHIGSVFPGLLLTSAIAAAGFALRLVPGMATFSPMILSILTGIAFHNIVGTPNWAKPGGLASAGCSVSPSFYLGCN